MAKIKFTISDVPGKPGQVEVQVEGQREDVSLCDLPADGMTSAEYVSHEAWHHIMEELLDQPKDKKEPTDDRSRH